MTKESFNLDPFKFTKLKFLTSKITWIYLVIILISIFLLVWYISKNIMSNQEIFSVLQGDKPGIFLTKKCVRIYENDDKLLYRLSDLLKDSKYYSGEKVYNINFLNFPSISDKLNDQESTYLRKQVFIKAILPLIIKANQEVLEDRKKVSYLSGRMPKYDLTDKDIDTFKYLVNKYNVNVKINTPWDVITGINALVVKVNTIPNSLLLAIAILETDWGKSKVLREYKSLFSERNDTFFNSSDIPKSNKYSGTIKNFKTLGESVNSYFSSVNSSNQYKEFRNLRFKQLSSKKGIDVYSLTNTLETSSHISNYAAKLKNIIKENKLTTFDKYTEVKNNNPKCLHFK